VYKLKTKSKTYKLFSVHAIKVVADENSAYSSESCSCFSVWCVAPILEVYHLLLGNEGVSRPFSQADYHSSGWFCLSNFVEISQAVFLKGNLEDFTKKHTLFRTEWQRIRLLASALPAQQLEGGQ